MSELEINPENYYLDVLQNPDYYLTGEKPTFKKVIKEAYSREQVLKLLEPHLTIPKSIAEMLDFIYDNHFDSNDDISWVIANIDFLPTDEDYYTFDEWINQSVDNHNLALAYLAGKALGVELVKVVGRDKKT